MQLPDKLVYSCLDLDPKTLSQIQQETGLPMGELAGALLRLQLMGAAEEIWNNTYVQGTNRGCPEVSGPSMKKIKMESIEASEKLRVWV